MKSALITTLLILALAPLLLCADERQLATNADEQDVEQYLVDLNAKLFERYILHHDTERYGQVALDDYIFVASIGVIETREEVLTTADNLDITSLTITHNEFRHHGDTAVLVGKLDMEGSILGHTVNGQRRFMSVFVQLDGSWRLMARSLSPVVRPRQLFGEPE